MPGFNVSKSTIIDAPINKVYENVSNFNHWTTWSPWLITEPEAQVTVAEDNSSYSWEGKRVGSGNMKITNQKPIESVDYDLNFIKPWKSYASVRFELKDKGSQTEATWLMKSSLPWFMFWMKKMMTALIGMDFQRGLALLKDYSEDGEVHSKLDFKGPEVYAGCTYVGISNSCKIDEVGESMSQDFSTIWAFLENHKDLVAGEALSIYHKWDLANNKTKYTSGVPVSTVPDNLPDGITSGTIPQTSVYTLRHTGPYLHLGNAWSAMYSLQRSKVFKFNKKIDPFETYKNEPGKVSDNELITEIHFPTK